MHFTTIIVAVMSRNIGKIIKSKFYLPLLICHMTENGEVRKKCGPLWHHSDPQNGGTDSQKQELICISLTNNPFSFFTFPSRTKDILMLITYLAFWKQHARKVIFSSSQVP